MVRFNKPSRKPQSHLINIIKSTIDHCPNFALFLGAGASKTSGVKMSGDLIRDWRSAYHKMYGEGMPFDDYNDYPAFDTNEEYSALFESLYDQPSQRREFIESCIKDAYPSWGYIYLVNLLTENVFNTVFTTNFDDLLNEACYQFSGTTRPIVCAHDSSIRSIRITSKRPKIIKLHGDFLFDNIKNTVTELETLEDNMKEKFRQYATEFGLIVVGYSGSDRSIMDTLSMLLKSENNFPHGIYWCVQKGATLTPTVEMMTHYANFRIIEIAGFDDLFADIHESLAKKLQPELSDPYSSLATRLNRLIEKANVPKPGKNSTVIERDLRLISQKISQFSKSRHIANLMSDGEMAPTHPTSTENDKIASLLPFEMLSEVELRTGNARQGLDYLLSEAKVRPSHRVFKRAFEAVYQTNELDFEEPLMAILHDSKDVYADQPNQLFDIVVVLLNAEKYDLADDVLDTAYSLAMRSPQGNSSFIPYYWINRLQTKLHRGQTLTENEINQLGAFTANDPLTSMGANIVLGDYTNAQLDLLESIETGMESFENIISWPIFKLLKNHIDNDTIKKLLIDVENTRLTATPNAGATNE
jgi:NAD-dependent SIR2 family protein deacetylase